MLSTQQAGHLSPCHAQNRERHVQGRRRHWRYPKMEKPRSEAGLSTGPIWELAMTASTVPYSLTEQRFQFQSLCITSGARARSRKLRGPRVGCPCVASHVRVNRGTRLVDSYRNLSAALRGREYCPRRTLRPDTAKKMPATVPSVNSLWIMSTSSGSNAGRQTCVPIKSKTYDQKACWLY